MKVDYRMIADLNIMKEIGLEYTPALEINGEVLSQGSFYTLDEMKALILEHASE